MKSLFITALFTRFESAASTYQDVECWSARELQNLLGYSKWENFARVIDKAKEACSNAGFTISDHFPDVRKMVKIGKEAQLEIEAIPFCLYAFCLLTQATKKHIK